MQQRWLFRTPSYEPPKDPIQTRHYDVEPIHRKVAKEFVVTHHYSGTCSAAPRFAFGLFRRGELVGAAVFAHPQHDAQLTNVFEVEARRGLDLSRFVLLDEVPANGETFFLGRAFDQLRQEDGLFGVIAYADPVPRADDKGGLVMPGHVGTIYAAHNGSYLGRARSRTMRLFDDGQELSARSSSKVRNGERSMGAAIAQLVAHGAREPREGEDLARWIKRWTGQLTRPYRHRGNHKYAWVLRRKDRRSRPSSLPYPKVPDRGAA